MGNNKKQTRRNAASSASAVLKDANATDAQRSAAGSALAQSKHDKETGEAAASNASHVLRDKNATPEEKSAAGSALSQKGH